MNKHKKPAAMRASERRIDSPRDALEFESGSHPQPHESSEAQPKTISGFWPLLILVGMLGLVFLLGWLRAT